MSNVRQPVVQRPTNIGLPKHLPADDVGDRHVASISNNGAKKSSRMISPLNSPTLEVTEEARQLLEQYLQPKENEQDYARSNSNKDGQYVSISDPNQNSIGHYVDILEGSAESTKVSNGNDNLHKSADHKKKPLSKRIQESFRLKKKAKSVDDQLVEADAAKEVVAEKNNKKNWFRDTFRRKKSDKTVVESGQDSDTKLDWDKKVKRSSSSVQWRLPSIGRSKSSKSDTAGIRPFSKKDEKYVVQYTAAHSKKDAFRSASTSPTSPKHNGGSPRHAQSPPVPLDRLKILNENATTVPSSSNRHSDRHPLSVDIDAEPVLHTQSGNIKKKKVPTATLR